MSSKFDKYLPKYARDNSTDGGYHDDRHIMSALTIDDKEFHIHPSQEKRYRERYNICSSSPLSSFSNNCSNGPSRLEINIGFSLC